MPRAPTYDAFRVEIANPGAGRFLPTVDGSATLEAGRTLQAQGQRTQQIGAAISDMIDEGRAREADTALTQATLKLLHDPETGYLRTEGKNAIDGFAAAQKALEEAVSEAGAGLKNGRQQAMFKQVAQARTNAALGQMAEHAGRAATAYNIDQASAQLSTYANEAAANPFDTTLLDSRKALTAATAARIAQLKGLDPDSAELLKLKATTNFHAGVLDSLIARDRGSEAREYLAAHESEIDPTKLPQMKAVTKQASIKAESTNLADDLADEGGTLTQQLAKLRDRYEKGEISAELRDATQDRLEHNNALKNQAIVENNRAALGQAQEFFLRNPGAPVSSMPAPLYAALKAAGNLDAAMSLSKMTGAEARGGKVESDLFSLVKLYDQAANEPLAFARSFDPRDYVGKLTPGDLKSLILKAASINRGEAAAIASGKSLSAGLRLLDPDLRASGLNPRGKPGSADAEKYAAFRVEYESVVNAEVGRQGRSLTAAEARDLGLGLLAEGEIEGTGIGGWFAKSARAYELAPGERSKLVVKYENIPRADALKIADYLAAKRGGKPPSRTEVEQVYHRYQLSRSK